MTYTYLGNDILQNMSVQNVKRSFRLEYGVDITCI